MSKSVKKEILASEYASEQVLAVNTNMYHNSILKFPDLLQLHFRLFGILFSLPSVTNIKQNYGNISPGHLLFTVALTHNANGAIETLTFCFCFHQSQYSSPVVSAEVFCDWLKE